MKNAYIGVFCNLLDKYLPKNFFLTYKERVLCDYDIAKWQA